MAKNHQVDTNGCDPGYVYVDNRRYRVNADRTSAWRPVAGYDDAPEADVMQPHPDSGMRANGWRIAIVYFPFIICLVLSVSFIYGNQIWDFLMALFGG